MADLFINVAEVDGKAKLLSPTQPIIPQMRIQQKQRISQTSIPEVMTGGTQWAWWGKRDTMPTDIRTKLEAVPIAMAAIDRKVKMLLGRGVAYFNESDIKDGNGEVKRQWIPEVEDFLRINRINTHFLPAQAVDYMFYMNTFSELVFNLDKDYITNIFHKSAEFCRLSRQDKKTLDIQFVLYSPKFAREYGQGPTADEAVKIPRYIWYDEDGFFEWLNGFKFAWHSSFPSPGAIYYARPSWIGLFKENGWLDISANVPKIVSAMQKNQVTLKYQIQIPVSWLEIRYRDWQTFTQEEQLAKFAVLEQEIEDYLTGTDNWYKSLISYFEEDKMSGNPRGLVRIIAIDDKTKAGTWIPDSNISDAQIVQGLGVHPSQIGLQPQGGKMGAGSGSDQRESYNTSVLLQSVEQEIILEPLNWISRFNKWGVRFVFINDIHTTTNEQETGVVDNPMNTKVN